MADTARVKNAWSYTSTPQYASEEGCLIKQWIRLHGVGTGTTLP